MTFKTVVIVGLIVVSVGAGVALGLQLVSDSPSGDAQTYSASTTLEKVTDQSETPEPATRPQELRIPKLGISTAVEHVGLNAEREMDVPKDADNVAWYQHGPTPGEAGNAVLAGHLDSETGPAVFYKLSALEAGDEVEVLNDNGEYVTFRVTHKADYPVEEFPLVEVFGQAPTSRLNLITCTGSFDKASRNYSHRTVVYTELAESV